MAEIHIYAPLCIAAGALFPPICIGLVALRLVARKRGSLPIGLDDWLTVPACALLVGMCIAVLQGVGRHAVGYPSPPIPPGETLLTVSSSAQTIVRSTYWSIELMQVPALGCLKASLLLFYKRIFYAGTHRFLRWSLLATLALTVAWTIAFCFTFLLICHRKFDAYWTTLVDEKKYCLDTVMIHNVYGVTDVVLDLIVILLPIPMLWPLQMPWSRKFGILGVFVLGALSVVASMFRMVTYLQSTQAEFLQGTDTSILITGGIYWSIVETGLAIICCCLPTVQALFRGQAQKTPTYPSYKRESKTNLKGPKTAEGPFSLRKSRRDEFNELVEFEELPRAEEGQRKGEVYSQTKESHAL